MEEHLTSICNVLGSIPSVAKQTNKQMNTNVLLSLHEPGELRLHCRVSESSRESKEFNVLLFKSSGMI